jgi:hypothetical protein
MKGEVNKLNQELAEFSNNMHVEDLNKIYYKQSYDSIKTLWIDKDLEAFEEKEKKIIKFLKRIDTSKRLPYLIEEAKAYTQVLYEIQCKIRSDELTFIGSIVADAWFIQRVDYYMDLYDETGDKRYYFLGRKLLNQIKKVHDKLSTPKSLKNIKIFHENLLTNDDLTDGDIEILECLKEYIENHPFLLKNKDIIESK